MTMLMSFVESHVQWFALFTFLLMLMANASGPWRSLLMVAAGGLAVFLISADLELTLQIFIVGSLLVVIDRLRLLVRS